MAITEVGTITQHGIDIGYSDTFNALYNGGNLTIEELLKYAWCASEEPFTNAWLNTDINVGNQQAAAVTTLLSYIQRTSEQVDYDYKFTYVNGRIQSGKPYSFNILVYAAGSEDYNAFNINSDNGSKYRLVTSIDSIQKIYAYVYKVDKISSSFQLPTAGTVDQYYSDTYARLRSTVDNGELYIYPMTVYVNGENFYISVGACFAGNRINYEGSSNDNFYSIQLDYIPERNAWITDMTYRCSYGVISDYAKETYLLRWAGNDLDSFVSAENSANDINYYEYSSDVGIFIKTDGTITYFTWYMFPKTEDSIYKLLALMGLKCKFETGEHTSDTLIPIIENTMVTGYSFDPDVETEFSDITDVTGNNISPTPPTPPVPPGPYDDDPWSGASFSGVGVGGAGAFAKCYYMTSTELANLRTWMNSNNGPEGFDPMAQIIGLSQVPVSLSGDDNDTVQFVNSSAVYDPGVTRVVDSGVSTQIAMGTPKRYSLGSVDIVRRMQERGEPYLDYDCQIELYLPLIGVFSLDTQAVMGRTITAEAVLDPISGTLAAYAYVSRDGQNLPIAYGSTTIGVDLPITAQQYSVARAALKQANAQLGTSLLSSTLSLIAAATAGGKGSGTGAKTATGSTNGLAAAGIREAGADYMKASQAGNVFGDFMQWGRTIRQLSYGNNTAVAGSFGGSTAQWAYPFTPYVKIIRPRYEKPSNYNHSQGVPCVQAKTVGSCTGFIQCIGVDVSGITGATDIELQAIQAALSNGVFAGGDQ